MHRPGAQSSLLDRVRAMTNLDPASCLQCGKCTAGCPMASEMDLKPHGAMRLLQLDAGEKLLSSESLWLCVSCGTCTARCPSLFDPAAIMDALREIVLKETPGIVPRQIRAFHSAFLHQVWKHGRIFEPGLLISYKLRSGTLLADVGSVPGMIARGKLLKMPHRIKRLKELRGLFEHCSMEKPR
jgi:heterodisulfide reductase subunit C2